AAQPGQSRRCWDTLRRAVVLQLAVLALESLHQPHSRQCGWADTFPARHRRELIDHPRIQPYAEDVSQGLVPFCLPFDILPVVWKVQRAMGVPELDLLFERGESGNAWGCL